MQGYKSRFAGGEEWPDTYVVVRVEPEGWLTTLSLPDLVDLVQGPGAGRLRDHAMEKRGDLLALRLGPVELIGSSAEWMDLAVEVRDQAGSAAGLHDSPNGPRWMGDPVTVPVERVEVFGSFESGRPMEPALSSNEETLARAGRFDSQQWTDLFGVGWRPGEGYGTLFAEADVYVWGTPAQLAARPTSRGLEVGMAGGSWDLPGQFVDDIVEGHAVSAETPRELLGALLRDLLHRRRVAFTWCRYCGKQVAPERRHSADLCYGCASNLLGVVY